MVTIMELRIVYILLCCIDYPVCYLDDVLKKGMVSTCFEEKGRGMAWEIMCFEDMNVVKLY